MNTITATAPAYFTGGTDDVDRDTFRPTPAAGGHWGEDLLSGPAVAGVAAWALERDFGQPDFMPSRFTIDLMKPARRLPVRVQTRMVRDGRRARYTECDVLQGDWIVARASMVQYLRSEAPPGQQWAPGSAFMAPRDLRGGPPGDELFVGSDTAGWSVLGAEHQNTSRKRACYRGVDVVAGRPLSPFVRAVVVAEAATNMVVNLGTHGIGYINGDLTVSLSRLPGSEFIGVQGDSHLAADGVAVGSATLYDADGPVGTAMVTALANPAAQIDFAGAARTQAPGSELFGPTVG